MQHGLVDLKVYDVALDALQLYGGNARRGDIAKIAESLDANGQYRPIVVRRETGEVLAGNHTLQAARTLGWASIKVTYLDGLTDDQARRIVLVDNKANDLAAYDDEALLALLSELGGDLTGTLFEAREVDELLARFADTEPLTDVEDVPEPAGAGYQPLTAVGDVWQLGPHRLAVGDSTDADVLRAACDGRAAAMLLTDPPYNVAYEGGTK